MYSLSRFVDDEGKRTNTGDEIRQMWKEQLLGTLFVRLARVKEFKKMEVMLEVAKIGGLHEPEVIDRL